MSTLIGLERAKLSIPAAGTGDERLLEALIAATSRAIETYCARVFGPTAFDEYPATSEVDRRVLLLSRFPVQSVESVRHSPTSVLEISQTDTATNQQARVTVTSTGLDLVRVASGVRVAVSLTYAANPTLGAMATTIAALGLGWAARAVGGYSLWPSADLWVAPRSGDATRSAGALSCGGTYAPLYLHVGEASDYDWDYRGWIAPHNLGGSIPSFWLLGDPSSPTQRGSFYRVQYTAGFAEIPADVQEACALWVQELYYVAQRDPTLTNALTAAGTASGYAASAGMPGRVKGLLDPYRVRNV